MSSQRVFPLVVITVFGLPFACGGPAFTTGATGPGDDASAQDGVADGTATDGMATDGAPADVVSDHLDARAPHDAGGPQDAQGGESSTSEGGDASVLTGTVVDSQLQPVPNALVEIQLGAGAQTDAQGHFKLPAPSGAYDIYVVSTTSTGVKHGYAFEGLTRLDPTLQLSGDSVPVDSARVSGTVVLAGGATNGVVLVDPATGAVVQGNETAPLTSSSLDYADVTYWVGPATLAGTAYALEWSSTGGVYFTYAPSPVTLSSAGGGATYNVVGGTMVPSGELTPSIKVSPGYALNYSYLYWQPKGASLAAPIIRDVSGQASPIYATPATGDAFALCSRQISNATTDAGLVDAGTAPPAPAYGDACVAGLAATSSAALALPTAPTLVSPPTTGVTAMTPFSWAASSASDVIYSVTFTTAALNAPQLYLVTSATTGHLPNLSLAGVLLPSGTTYTVSVTAIGTFAGTDAAAGPSGYYGLPFDRLKNIGPTFDGVVANGGNATFVTQ